MIGGKPAARMGDLTVHGGTIASGCPNVMIGDVAAGSPPSPVVLRMVKATLSQMNPADSAKAAQVIAMVEAAAEGVPFCEDCARKTLMET
jgi:hypothetical protein